MSLHYELVLSVRLRPDLPEAFLAELRYHLGLINERPELSELEYDFPCFVTGMNDDLPGGAVRSLKLHQSHPGMPPPLGVYVRILITDDDLYDIMTVVPSWLARWSAEDGWIGFAREQSSRDVWLNFVAAGGHAYAAEPGEQPTPLQVPAPVFPLDPPTST